MSKRLRTAGTAFSIALALITGAWAAVASLEGRWRLVEQRYESGGSNFAQTGPPLRLEFARTGTGLVGRIWAGGEREPAREWPAYVTDDGPLPRNVEEVAIDPAEGRATARYRVAPVPGDELSLEVIEEYRIEEDGETLAGTVRVRFHGSEGPRGGFVLHRRFVRER